MQNALAISSSETAFVIFPGLEESVCNCMMALRYHDLKFKTLVWDKGHRYSVGGGERLTYSTETILVAWRSGQDVS